MYPVGTALISSPSTQDPTISSHVFHEIYLHINWHTKADQPLLSSHLEPQVHDFLRERCRNTDGVYLHAVGGTETHIHIAVNIAPSVCISDLVVTLKGSCSHEINSPTRDKILQWQRGFGVVSFGNRRLDWVKQYIARQKEHHARGRVHARLERVSFDDDGSPFESA